MRGLDYEPCQPFTFMAQDRGGTEHLQVCADCCIGGLALHPSLYQFEAWSPCSREDGDWSISQVRTGLLVCWTVPETPRSDAVGLLLDLVAALPKGYWDGEVRSNRAFRRGVTKALAGHMDIVNARWLSRVGNEEMRGALVEAGRQAGRSGPAWEAVAS